MDESIRIRTRAKIRSNLLGVLLIVGISCLGLVSIGVAVGVGVGLGTSGTTTTSAPPVIPPVTTTSSPIPPITTTLLPIATTTTKAPTTTSNPITTTTKTLIPITTTTTTTPIPITTTTTITLITTTTPTTMTPTTTTTPTTEATTPKTEVTTPTTEATTPTTEATTPTTEATTPTTEATTPTTEATTSTTEGTTPTTEATTPTTEATTPTTEATTPTTEATTPTTEATTPTTEATTPTTETTTETTTTPTSTTSPPPKGFKISSQLTLNPSQGNPSSTDKSLLQESLRIKLHDVSDGAPFYIELGPFQADKNSFSVVIYYDKDTDCSQVDCESYFDKLNGVEFKSNPVVKYTVSPPVDIATNLEPILEDEWEGIKDEKDKGEQIFDTKIDATCKAIGSVTKPDDAKKSLQAALCGILADTEIAPGVPFYIEALGYTSVTKEFPITIYYERPEVCAGGCEQFIKEKLKDIKIKNGLTCTVAHLPTGIHFNRVPVEDDEFITEKEKCETNNYVFEKVEIVKINGFRLEDKLQIPIQQLICALIADDLAKDAFYVEVGDYVVNPANPPNHYLATLYCKGTSDGAECVKKLNKTLGKIKIPEIAAEIKIDIASKKGAPMTVKKWSGIVTKRNKCPTANREIPTTIKFTDSKNVVEGDKDDLQKSLCNKIKPTKEGSPYYIEVTDFNSAKKQFKSVIYYKYDKTTGIVDCSSNTCEKYLDAKLKDQVLLTSDGKSLTYTVVAPDKIEAKLNGITVEQFTQIEATKEMKCPK